MGSITNRTEGGGSAERRRALRVLVAEPDVATREALGSLFEQELECSVDVASDASETMGWLQCGGPYSLLVVSCELPGAREVELISSLRRWQKQGEMERTAVLAISHDQGMQLRALGAGASGFLAKPFGADDLVRSTHEALGR